MVIEVQVNSSVAVLGDIILFASSKWRGNSIMLSSSFICSQFELLTPAADADCVRKFEILSWPAS